MRFSGIVFRVGGVHYISVGWEGTFLSGVRRGSSLWLKRIVLLGGNYCRVGWEGGVAGLMGSLVNYDCH